MKYSWNYKFDGKSYLFSLIPIIFILYTYKVEESLFTLLVAAILGITTLVQVLKTRQRDVLSIENRKMYKKNIFGKVKEIDLLKYKEISVDYLNKKKAVLVGFFLDENQHIHKDTLLQNEYQVSLDAIKAAIDQSLSGNEQVEEEEDFYLSQVKQTYLKDDSESLEQASYRKTVKVANIVLAACYMFIVVLALIYYENTVEGIFAILLVIYTLLMFSISQKIMNQDFSIPEKRKYNLLLYLPGIILMFALAIMIFDN